MSAATKPLGAELDERTGNQRALREERNTPDHLAVETKAIELQARLLSVHPAVHPRNARIAERRPDSTYEQLRGYRDPSALERLIIIITIQTVSVRV
jgi:hypothetical protein